jgi:hypothetical protein
VPSSFSGGGAVVAIGGGVVVGADIEVVTGGEVTVPTVDMDDETVVVVDDRPAATGVRDADPHPTSTSMTAATSSPIWRRGGDVIGVRPVGGR